MHSRMLTSRGAQVARRYPDAQHGGLSEHSCGVQVKFQLHGDQITHRSRLAGCEAGAEDRSPPCYQRTPRGSKLDPSCPTLIRPWRRATAGPHVCFGSCGHRLPRRLRLGKGVCQPLEAATAPVSYHPFRNPAGDASASGLGTRTRGLDRWRRCRGRDPGRWLGDQHDHSRGFCLGYCKPGGYLLHGSAERISYRAQGRLEDP